MWEKDCYRKGLGGVDYIGRIERKFISGEDCEGKDHDGDNVRGDF